MSETLHPSSVLPAKSGGVTRATKPRNKRRALARVDHRFAIGRRIKQLVAVFSARIGADAADPVTSTAIRRCAETVALSEDLRARMLRGEKVSADDVLRSSRTADLLTRRLRLDQCNNTERQSSLRDYLSTRGGSTS
jgi:hypothetical protein